MLVAGVAHTDVEADDTILRNMAASLSYSTPLEAWNLGRVGLVGPQPTFRPDRSKCGLVIGQIFGDSEISLQDLLNAPSHEISSLARRLNGSFCVVLADLEAGGITLISDRFGSKPMFYALSDSLVFGSQAIAVLQSPNLSREVNLQSLFELMAFQTVLATKTLEKRISVLPPASILTFDGECSIERYWDRRHRPVEASADEFAEEMAAIFARTMSRIGGENPAIMLSGGLDSRMVFAACKDPPHCLTMGDYANNEYRVAAKIAQARGVSTELLQRDPDHYVHLVDPAVRIGSGMYNIIHAHALGFLETLSCDVLLHGNCLESYFRGAQLPRKLHKVGRLRVAKTLIPLNERTYSDVIKERSYYTLLGRDPSQVFSPDLAAMFSEAIDESIDCCHRAAKKISNDPYDHFLWFANSHPTKNPTSLFQLAFSSYTREGSLLFDNDVIDLHLKMPQWARADNRIWLKALARLNPKIARVPNANTGWHHRVPVPVTQVLNAPKSLRRRMKRVRSEWEKYQSEDSYPLSANVLRYNTRMQDLIASAIDDLDPGLFNLRRLREMFEAQIAGKENWTTFLHLAATFSRWRSLSPTTATESFRRSAHAPSGPPAPSSFA